MGDVRFDRTRWPIVVVAIEGTPTDEDIDRYLGGLGALLREDARGVVVVDGTRAEAPSRAQRQRIGEWMRAHREEQLAPPR